MAATGAGGSKKKVKNKFKPDAEPDAAARPPAAVTERRWNEGAGDRPGGNSGKSLLGDEDSAIWHELASTTVTPGQRGPTPSDDVIEVKTKVAERLIEAETNAFDRKLSKTNNADFQWLQTVRRSGTSQDKIAANALVVEQNALANLHALDELIGLASKRGGAQGAAGHASDALKELFMTVLLPDRRLVAFDTRPLGSMKPSKAGDRQLLLWWVEDCIKRRYSMFIKALEDMATGGLDWAKEKALRAAAELLAAKPEAEARLLALIVNKLGDPNRRVASNAGYHISRLLTQHPVMGSVVVREVETFLFRPNQKARARYYAIVTLNQMVLSHDPQHGSPLAVKLINIYFTLFQQVLDGKLGFYAERAAGGAAGDTGDEPHSASNTAEGKGRKRETRDVRERRDRKGASGRGKQKHHGGKRRGPKPMKEAKTGPTTEEVDARLLGALLTGVRRAHPYVEAGSLDDVFKAHADQVFRTVHVAPLTVAAQALMLLFQVMNSQAASSDRFYATLYAVLLRPALERSSALNMIFGLLFQAMKADISNKRVSAFIKRVLQVATGAPANVACGALLMVSEVLKAKPALWAGVTQPEDHGQEEVHDAPDDVPGVSGTHSPCDVAAQHSHSSDRKAGSAAQGSAGHGHGGSGIRQAWPAEGSYSMKKRSPQFAGAERACWWELSVLRCHVHPSVSTMACTLLAGTSVLYNGDPLADLTVLAFLEKFVKRRPKKVGKGSSVMQPIAALDAPQHVAVPAVGSARSQSPGSQAFAALAEEDVAADDVFFHRYFTMERVKQRRAATARTRALRRKARKHADESDDDMDGGDDEGPGAGDDDSAAEDEFLEDLEQMPDDMLGDPDAGVDLEKALRGATEEEDSSYQELDVDVNSDSDGGDAQTEVVTKPDSVSKEETAGDLSDDIELVGDEDLEHVDVFALPVPSDTEGDTDGSLDSAISTEVGADETGTADNPSVSSDIGVEDDSSIEEGAFAKAMFGGDSGDDVEEEHIQVSTKRETDQSKRVKKKRKKGKGMEVFADYEQYAHVLDSLDPSNQPATVPRNKKVKTKK